MSVNLTWTALPKQVQTTVLPNGMIASITAQQDERFRTVGWRVRINELGFTVWATNARTMREAKAAVKTWIEES